ncbi:hypothetical protein [Natronococcus roseus]|uniref:hypothetical protein n=1 Tax=Natronococcus roseus TaxID=1052014 RepID=UPI00374D726F
MIERLERREDTEGCACLECRGVQSRAMRRSLVDAIQWSGRILRTRRSLVVLVFVLASLQVGMRLASLGVELLLSGFVFMGGLFARNYAITLIAGRVRGRRVAASTAMQHALARLPAVIGTWILTFGILMLVTGVLTGVGMGAVAAVWGPDVLTTPFGLTALWIASIGLGIPVIVKFALATEAAVIGGYGPFASLRVSWGLISFRRRTAIALIGVVVSFAVPIVLWNHMTTLSSSGVADATVLAVFGSIGGAFLTVVWYCCSCVIFGQLYVQRVLR